MKKIVLACAIACCAVLAQAATFKWSAGNIYAGNENDKYTGSANIYVSLAGAGSYSLLDVAAITSGTFSLEKAYASLEGGKYYDVYFTIEDSTLGTFTSAVKENQLASATQTTTVGWGNMKSATASASGWSSVPEPTSGLLLLLGVAGLALKRKCA